MAQVFIPLAKWDAERYFSASLEKLKQAVQVFINSDYSAMSPDSIISRGASADIFVVGKSAPLTSEILNACSGIKLVACIEENPAECICPEAFEKDIKIISCAKAFARYRAEFALASILSMFYDLPYQDSLVRNDKTDHPHEGGSHEKFGWKASGLRKSKVVFAGSSQSAVFLSEILKPFECEILSAEDHPLEKILPEADIVSAHGGEMIFSADMISAIPDGALLLLCEGMESVDEEALFEQLEKDRFKAALNLKPMNKLWFDRKLEKKRNVRFSCPDAEVTDKTFAEGGEDLADDIIRYIEGETLKYEFKA